MGGRGGLLLVGMEEDGSVESAFIFFAVAVSLFISKKTMRNDNCYAEYLYDAIAKHMQPIVVVGGFLVLDGARKGRVRVFLTNQINSCERVKRVRSCCFERWTHDQPETADLVSETSWISYWYHTVQNACGWFLKCGTSE